jgi:rhodanese-related sulfurtransferase
MLALSPLFGLFSWLFQQDPAFRRVTNQEFQQAMAETVLLLDVRTPAEYAAGHLPGAVLLDFQAPGFAEALAGLDRKVHTLVYCRSGKRSLAAMEMMREAGWLRVTELKNGIVGWQEAGLGVVAD